MGITLAAASTAWTVGTSSKGNCDRREVAISLSFVRTFVQ